jgi:hypothetical protein
MSQRYSKTIAVVIAVAIGILVILRMSQIPANFISNHSLLNVKDLHSYSLNLQARNNRLNQSTINAIKLNDTSKTNQASGITYSAKFECGKVFADEDSLRPGYYDTDVSILNRQVYPITVLLNIVNNNYTNKPLNYVIKTIQPQKTTSISCRNLLELINSGSDNIGIKDKLVEGFVVIVLQFDNKMFTSLTGTSITSTQKQLPLDQRNLLDIQVFYSVNSLAIPTHKTAVDQISFSILDDTCRKIPHSMLFKILEVIIKSQINEIFDPEFQVKSILASKYNLSSSEQANLKIRIIATSTGVTTVLDRHAISSLQVKPQVIY